LWNEQRHVAAVINDELRTEIAGEQNRLERKVPNIPGSRLTLPRTPACRVRGNRGGRVILRGEKYYRKPNGIRTDGDERFR